MVGPAREAPGGARALRSRPAQDRGVDAKAGASARTRWRAASKRCRASFTMVAVHDCARALVSAGLDRPRGGRCARVRRRDRGASGRRHAQARHAPDGRRHRAARRAVARADAAGVPARLARGGASRGRAVRRPTTRRWSKRSAPVRLGPGEPTNFKITTPRDLELAEAWLARRDGPGLMSLRVGIGYDIHRRASGRRLVLGGVTLRERLGARGPQRRGRAACTRSATRCWARPRSATSARTSRPAIRAGRTPRASICCGSIRALLARARRPRGERRCQRGGRGAAARAPPRARCARNIAGALELELGQRVGQGHHATRGSARSGAAKGIAAWAVALVEVP